MNRKLIDSIYKHSMIFAAIFFVGAKSLDLYYADRQLKEMKISNRYTQHIFAIYSTLTEMQSDERFYRLERKYLGNNG